MTALESAPGTTVDRRRADGPPAPGWGPLAVVLTGTLVTFLDFFVVNVALPSIGADLHAGGGTLSLVVAGYGLTFAAGMIVGGRLGDVFGARRVFAAGLLAFTVSSVACGLAPGAGLLVGARMLQGAAGALLTPQVLALLGTVYAGPRRETAFAAYGFAMGIAAVVGQLLGGALITADVAGLGWRLIFLINLPVGLVTLPFVPRVLPAGTRHAGGIDLGGAALGAGAVTALVLPLVEGRERGWPWWTWLGLALAPVLAAAFVAHQRGRAARGRDPLLRLALFRVRSFTVGTLAGAAFGLVPAAFFFVLALYLQVGRGCSALFSGALFGVLGLAYFAALLVAPALHARLGHRVLTAGALVVAAGCGLLAAFARAASSAALVPGLLLVGAGIALVLVPLSSVALAGVDARHAGGAAGVLATAQQVGGALGVAVVGTVFLSVSGPAATAFAVSLGVLAGLCLVTVALARWLPAHRG